MKYLAVLGQNPLLSLAELSAEFPDMKIIAQKNEAVVFSAKNEVRIERLGGCPKIAELIGEFPPDVKKIGEAISQELFSFSKEQKIFFGLSFYGNANKNFYNSLGKSIKFRLTESGYRARWVVSRELALSSVLIKTNKLLTRGADFDLFFSTGKIIVAKTADVQDFSDYEFRDIKRPARDLVSGIMPPKLAKILVNLGGRQKEIFDPFCGSGTILGEAALLGFRKIRGSDASAKAVADTKKNLAWLKEKYNFSADIEARQCDVKNSYACWNRKFDFIATEPYLGPALRGRISLEKAKALRGELEKNYQEYLIALSEIMAENGLLVIIVPFIVSEGGVVKVPLKIEGTRLEAVREPIPYCRPDQKVGREIYILRKF